MRLDLDLLHGFVVVCDTGSLTAASRRVHRSQSALSEQMQKLEEACGRPLLVRGKTGVHPTPAGERLLQHARQLLGMSELAYQDVQGIEIAGTLRLAMTDYFRPAEIIDILARIRARYPRLRLQVSVRKSALIEEDPDEFDIGIKGADGWYRSWPKSAVKVELHDPLTAHRNLMEKYTDADIHNLFAYLQTLK